VILFHTVYNSNISSALPVYQKLSKILNTKKYRSHDGFRCISIPQTFAVFSQCNERAASDLVFIHGSSILCCINDTHRSSPICGKNVHSRDINKHLDESCSARTVVGSSGQEPARCDVSGGDDFRTARVPNVLAPIFSNKSKSTSTSTPGSGSHTRIKDSLNVTFSQGKRPAAEESPTPASKKHKSIVNVPLAEKFRPKEFSDFLGQAHIMEPGSLLFSMLKAEATWSIILWGPPG